MEEESPKTNRPPRRPSPPTTPLTHDALPHELGHRLHAVQGVVQVEEQRVDPRTHRAERARGRHGRGGLGVGVALGVGADGVGQRDRGPPLPIRGPPARRGMMRRAPHARPRAPLARAPSRHVTRRGVAAPRAAMWPWSKRAEPAAPPSVSSSTQTSDDGDSGSGGDAPALGNAAAAGWAEPPPEPAAWDDERPAKADPIGDRGEG